MTYMTRTPLDSTYRGPSWWWAKVLGVVLVVLGVILGVGGLWLALLGGSWYYLFAGLGLMLSGGTMLQGRSEAVPIYFIVWVLTLVWAFWEVGLDGWALVPRIVAPTVMLVLVLLTIPGLHRARLRRMAGPATIALLAAIGLTGAPVPAVAQDEAPAEPLAESPDAPAPEAEVPAPEAPAPDAPASDAPAADAETPEAPAASPEAPAPAPESPAPEAATPAPTEAAPDSAPVPTEPVPQPAPAAPAPAPEAAAPAPSEPPPQAEAPEAAAPVSTEPSPQPQPVAERGPREMMTIGADWPAYGGDLHGTRYSPLTQITRDNVADLEQAWVFHTGDMPRPEADGRYSPENTPLKIGDSLYICTGMNIMMALDAATGAEKWRYNPQVQPESIPYGATCRGVAYHAEPETNGACAARIIEGTLDARLIAVDAETGLPCADFGTNGMVDLNEGMGETAPGWYAVTSPPTIVRGVAVVGAQVSDNQHRDAPSGVIRGYDALTGDLLWAWDMANPELTGMPPEGEAYSRGTPNMWTIAAGDEELGHVYLPMGNSAVDYYGALRSEVENDYATSLVALDVTTGQPAWHFQTVHYDVWDYDLGSQPTLFDMPTEDGIVPALILPTKQSQIYILNRETGEPMHPVEEREVPSGGVEPENLSPTQPYSGFADMEKPVLTERDMWGMSPIDQLYCRIQFRRAQYDGEYTPPTVDKPFIQYPGYNGGSDWGSVAIDPERNLLVLNYNDMPNFNQLIPREEADEQGIQPLTEPGGEVGNPMWGSPYAIDVNAGWRVPGTGLLCKEPPYGWIRAIDLTTGETKWDHPFGSAERNGPFGLPSFLPLDIGTPNNGGPVVTAGGLIFIAATTDNKFRAYDIETGEELWSADLPGGGQTTPIVYETGGRQYVVLAPGGHHFMETPISDAVMAWALPVQN